MTVKFDFDELYKERRSEMDRIIRLHETIARAYSEIDRKHEPDAEDSDDEVDNAPAVDHLKPKKPKVKFTEMKLLADKRREQIREFMSFY